MTATQESAAAFSVRGLTKAYPGFELGPVEMALDPGAVLAFVGPNGAGKTTLLNCMVGLCRADAGSVEVLGMENRPAATDWKQVLGYVGEHHGFYAGWSGQDNLDFLSGFYPRWNMERCRRLAARLDLPLDKQVRVLSNGNRAKLALVAALGHGPALLLLDEPFNGLDPVVRADVHDVLWQYLEDGMPAIMYSTHILSDIQRLADEIAFLRDGRLVLRAGTDALADSWRRISFRFDGGIEGIPAAHDARREGTSFRVLSSDGEVTATWLRERGADDIETTRLALEEIAVEILKGKERVATTGS